MAEQVEMHSTDQCFHHLLVQEVFANLQFDDGMGGLRNLVGERAD